MTRERQLRPEQEAWLYAEHVRQLRDFEVERADPWVAGLLAASQALMTAWYAVVVAENDQPPRGYPAVASSAGVPQYEPEHSERQASGSVAVGRGGRWFARLAVAMTKKHSILLTIERDGPRPTETPVVEQATLVIPAGEMDAVLILLQGIVAHARRDGVLG